MPDELHDIEKNRYPAIAIVAIGVILAIAGWIRSVHISESLWLDELHSSWVVSGSFADIGDRARMGNNHPFYFSILWCLVATCGESEWVYRSISWLSGLAVIGISFVVMLSWSRSLIAAVAMALLMAWDRDLVFFSTETRPYALVQLVTLVSCVCYFNYVKFGRLKWRLSWLALTTVAFFLHYTSLLVVAGQMVFGAAYFFVRRDDGSTGRRPAFMEYAKLWAVDGVVLCVVVSLSWSHLMFVADRRQNWEKFVHHRSLEELILVFPTLAILANAWLGLFAALLTRFLERLWSLRREGLKRQNEWFDWVTRDKLFYSLVWFFVPCLIILFLNNADIFRLFFRRYMVALLPAPYLAAAILIGIFRPKWLQMVVGMGVFILGLLGDQTMKLDDGIPVSSRSEDWRKAVATINEQPQGTMLFLHPKLIEDESVYQSKDDFLVEYCKFPVSGIYHVNPDRNPTVIWPSKGVTPIPGKTWYGMTNPTLLLIRGSPSSRRVAMESLLARQAATDRPQSKLETLGHFGTNLGLYRMRW